METLQTWLCDECGQMSNIERVWVLNTHTVRYCPSCGARSLRHMASTESRLALRAECFRPFPTDIVQPALELWSREHRDAYPLFRDFLVALCNGEVDLD